jgi:hypothetical protein
MMNSALRMFLRELVDYDGLLPPAGLSIVEALEVNLRERSSPHAWMLGRVVVPASRLESLASHALLRDIRLASNGQPLPVCVVIDSPDPRADYALVAKYVFGERQPIAVRALSVAITMASSADAGARVRAVVQKLAAAELPYTIPVFLEMPRATQVFVGDLMDAIARERQAGRSMLCAAIRCSGPQQDDVLEAADLAFFISAARRREIPMLASGVHASVRRVNPRTGVFEHGFFNVIGAAILSFAFDLNVQELVQMLVDERADHFHLNHDSFAWKERQVNKGAIFNARMSLARGISTAHLHEQADALVTSGVLPDLSPERTT